jgi:hypothetical protein
LAAEAKPPSATARWGAWRQLTGSDQTLDQEHLLRMAGRFSRRVHAYAKRHRIPLVHWEPGVHKHTLAEQYLPTDPMLLARGIIAER